MPERQFDQIKLDMIHGGRSRADIINDLLPSAGTEERTRKAILEVLLDIRDLLEDIKRSRAQG